jgi:hypothetical protein
MHFISTDNTPTPPSSNKSSPNNSNNNNNNNNTGPFLSENSPTYHTVPDDFQSGRIHYVDTEYRVSSVLVPLLTFGLDFVPTPINYESAIHTHVTTYSKYGKEILPVVLNTLQVSGKIPEFTMSHSKSQRLVHQVFHSSLHSMR